MGIFLNSLLLPNHRRLFFASRLKVVGFDSSLPTKGHKVSLLTHFRESSGQGWVNLRKVVGKVRKVVGKVHALYGPAVK